MRGPGFKFPTLRKAKRVNKKRGKKELSKILHTFICHWHKNAQEIIPTSCLKAPLTGRASRCQVTTHSIRSASLRFLQLARAAHPLPGPTALPTTFAPDRTTVGQLPPELLGSRALCGSAMRVHPIPPHRLLLCISHPKHLLLVGVLWSSEA